MSARIIDMSLEKISETFESKPNLVSDPRTNHSGLGPYKKNLEIHPISVLTLKFQHKYLN